MNGPSWLWTYLRHVFSGALRACVVDWSDDRAPPGAGCTDPGDRRLPRRRRHRELPVAGGCLLRGDDRLDEGPATARPCLLRRDPLARWAAGPCRAAAEGREDNVQKVLRLPVTGGTTVGDAREIVPASDLVIEDLAVTRR